MSRSAKSILPAAIGANPKIARPIVVFPDPDSPTNPNVSRGAI